MKSDSDLRHDIQVELLKQFSASAEKIGIQVLDGVVTLTGQVGSDLERWRLDDVVRTMGAQGLSDETFIVPELLPASPDPDIARPWFPGG